MKQRDQLLLQLGAQVNQQVTATDQVQLGKRRVFDDILFREHQHVPNALVHPVSVAFRLQCKKPGQALGGHVVRNAGRVNARAGHGNGAAVNVGGKHLYLEAGFKHVQLLLQQNGE